jgi:hypothetical protein
MGRERRSKFANDAKTTADLASSLAQMSTKIDPVIINAGIGLRRFKSALAEVEASSNKIINVNIINTSVGEGSGSGSRENSWTSLLRQHYANKFEDVGFGTIPYYQFSYYPTAEWSFSGEWVESAGFGMMNMVNTTNVGNSKATLTFKGTEIDILCVKAWVCGKINVSIDGGVPVQYDLNGEEEVIKAININGLSDGEHTLTITKVEDGSYFYLIGACPKRGSRGVRVNLVGRNGQWSPSAVGNNKSMTAEIDFWQPKLTIIEMFPNDVINNLDPATYKSTIQTLITRAKAFGDVLLFPTGVREDIYTYSQHLYIDALVELAISNNVCLVDGFGFFGGNFNYATNVLGYLADNVHPNALGASKLSELAKSVIG